MSTVSYNQSFRTTGGLQRFDCLAWVNFNGTGAVAIRASGNVSSITDNGVGDYTVNFTNALPDANYAFSLSIDDATSALNVARLYRSAPSTPTSTAFRIRLNNPTPNQTDNEYVSAVFFR